MSPGQRGSTDYFEADENDGEYDYAQHPRLKQKGENSQFLKSHVANTPEIETVNISR